MTEKPYTAMGLEEILILDKTELQRMRLVTPEDVKEQVTDSRTKLIVAEVNQLLESIDYRKLIAAWSQELAVDYAFIIKFLQRLMLLPVSEVNCVVYWQGRRWERQGKYYYLISETKNAGHQSTIIKTISVLEACRLINSSNIDVERQRELISLLRAQEHTVKQTQYLEDEVEDLRVENKKWSITADGLREFLELAQQKAAKYFWFGLVATLVSFGLVVKILLDYV